MDTAREIICEVTRSGKIEPYLKAGFTQAWLNDKESGWDGVFDGGAGPYTTTDVWEWMLAHHARHAAAPSQEQVQHTFPGLTDEYFDSASDYSAAELVETATQDVRRRLLDIMAEDVTKARKDKDYDKAVQVVCGTAERITAGPAVTSAAPFEIMDHLELDNLPKPESLIKDVIDKGSVFMLTGEFGTGKSFLALDWAACIATGSEWFDHDAKQGKVLYVAAEGGPADQAKRIAAWKQQHRADISRGSLDVVIKPVQFGDPNAMAHMTALIASNEYDMVIFDTLARCIVGLEENSAKDMGLVIDQVYKLRDAAGESRTAIGIVHHMGKAKNGARGSTAMPAGVDSVYELDYTDPTKGNQCNTLRLRCTKRKDGEPLRDLCLSRDIVTLASGYTSCVLNESDSPFPDPDGGVRKTMLRVLGENPGATVTVLLEKMLAAGDRVGRSSLHNVLNAAEQDGVIIRTKGAGRVGDTFRVAA